MAQPTYRNAAGQLLTAVGGMGNQIYGFYDDFKGGPIPPPPYHFELIASLDEEQVVAALESFHGDRIFVSTGLDGRMYVIETAQGPDGVHELKVILPKPTPNSQMQGGTCTRIVTFSGTDYFAVLNSASATIINPLIGITRTVTANCVLRLEGQQWVPTKGLGLPDDPMYGMEAVDAPDVQAQLLRALFVSTDDQVYISWDDGEHWMSASQGLPRRPHCADLRFVTDDEGGMNLYLSTYGRSVWVVQLR